MNAAFDPALRETVQRYTADNRENDMLAISRALRTYKEQNALIDSIYIYLPNHNQMIISTEYNPCQITELNEVSEWIAPSHASSGQAGYALPPLPTIDRFSASPKHAFMYTQLLAGDKRSDVPTWLVINIDECNLYYNDLDAMARNSDTNAYLLDPAGKIISGNCKTEYSEYFTNQIMRMPNEVSDAAKFTYQKDGVQYRVALCVSHEKLIDNLLFLQTSILILAFFIIFSSFLPAYYIAKRVNHPIDNLKKRWSKSGAISLRSYIHHNFSVSSINTAVSDGVFTPAEADT